MPLLTTDGQVLPLEVEWNGVKSCPGFLAIEGEPFGQTAHRSECNCEFHRILRSEAEFATPNT